MTGDSTALDEDLDIEHASVAGHSQWLEDTISLRWHMEVLNKRLSIDHDTSRTGAHRDSGARVFSLTETPRPARLVQLRLSFLLWQSPAKVEEIDAVELCEVISVVSEWTRGSQARIVEFIGELG